MRDRLLFHEFMNEIGLSTRAVELFHAKIITTFMYCANDGRGGWNVNSV